MTTTTNRWITVSQPVPLAGMNATPLIDVLLVLLIMFIITLPIMTHASRIDLRGGATTDVAPPVIRVEIEYGGTVLVNGETLDAPALERYFAHAHATAPASEIRIYTSDRAKYERFAQVIAVAQRSGFTRIGVTTLD